MATISASSNGYTLTLTLTQGSQSVTNNTTSLSWKLVFKCTDAYYQNSSTKDNFKVVINGSTVLNANKVISFSGSDTSITIDSDTISIPHNSDGTKTVSASISFTPGRSASYYPSSISKSGSMTLTTIPRAASLSDFTCSTSYLNGTMTIKYNSKYTFTYYLRLSANDNKIYRGSLGSQDAGDKSTTYTFSSSELTTIYNLIPDSTLIKIVAVIETYNGSTKIGESSEKTLTLKIPTTVIPTIGDLTVAEANTAVSALGVYVQNKSKLSLKISSASGVYGSSIKSYKITAGSYTINASSGTTGVITASGSLTINATVTDSRGRTASKSKTIDVIAYTSPLFANVKASRADTTCEISANGKCSSIKNGSTEKNAFKYKILYRVKGASSWTTLKEESISAITYAFSATITGLSESSSYEFQLYAGDCFGYSSPMPYDVSTARIPIDRDLKNGRTGINKKLEYDDSTIEFLEDALAYVGSEKIPLKQYAHHYLNASGGSAGYFYFCRIVVTGTYVNSPLKFEIFRRGKSYPTTLYLQFSNVNSNDPTVASFKFEGSSCGLYVVKSSTGTFDLYMEKSGSYDSAVVILTYNSSYLKNLNIQWFNSYVSSVPSGYTQATDEDSGWITATLTSNFSAYDSGGTVRYRKIGKMVVVRGVVKPTTTLTFTGTSETYTIFTLPSGYRPSNNIYTTCEGTSGGYWCCAIRTDGTVCLERNRSYSAGWRNAETSHWFPFHVVLFID